MNTNGRLQTWKRWMSDYNCGFHELCLVNGMKLNGKVWFGDAFYRLYQSIFNLLKVLRESKYWVIF